MNRESTPPAALDLSCDFDPKSIDVESALQRIMEQVEPVTQVETVALRAALGRAMAVDLQSRV